MLCGLATVNQSAGLDGLSLDPFSFQQDGVAAAEVDIGRGEVSDGLVVAVVIVVIDEGVDLGLEIAGEVVILEQGAVLERLMPALDLALGLRMERSSADDRLWHICDVGPCPELSPRCTS